MSFIFFEKWVQENTYKVLFNHVSFGVECSSLATFVWLILFGLEKNTVFKKESLEY